MNQFKYGIIPDIIIKKLTAYSDPRGWLIEIFREDEMEKEFLPSMGYISSTKSGIVRGPHEHREQTDVFAFVGPSNFKCYLWDNRKESKTYGFQMDVVGGEDKPILVIIPPGIVHGYKNIGAKDGFVINLPTKLYKGKNKQDPIDEIRHEEDPNSIFKIE